MIGLRQVEVNVVVDGVAGDDEADLWNMQAACRVRVRMPEFHRDELVTLGAGEPVFLLHGTPKTTLYWRHVVPLLTPHYTVIAVDNRGAGGSQRPLTGYDTATMARDVAALATHLGFGQFRVAGEDWGAAIAYAVAAFHRPRVQQLVFQETLLPGLPAGPGLPGGGPDPSLPADDMRTGWHFTSSACRTYPKCCWPGGNGRSGPGTPDARCGTPAR